MKMLIFAVRDSKAEAYMQPFFSAARGSAIRAFSDEVNNPKSPMGAHAADYTLFCIGTYDDQTGMVDAGSNGPVVMGNGLEYLIPDNQLSLMKEG